MGDHSMGPVQQRLEESLRQLGPEHLEVVNESHLHNVPTGSEMHFKILVVSNDFKGLTPVARHRRVYTLLGEEFKSGLHAVSIATFTPGEWEQDERRVPPSPQCRGGRA